MVTRFSCIGSIVKLGEPHRSKTSDQESVTISLEVGNGEVFPLILTGKLLSLLEEDKVRVGDKVYVEGKLRKDRVLTAEPPKMICVLFVNFLSVLP
jgi:hypothetical protein